MIAGDPWYTGRSRVCSDKLSKACPAGCPYCSSLEPVKGCEFQSMLHKLNNLQLQFLVADADGERAEGLHTQGYECLGS